jgi:hypothetical protein
MQWDKLSEVVGYECLSRYDDDESEAFVRTPFEFRNQDPFPIYLEPMGLQLRIHDDREVLLSCITGKAFDLPDVFGLNAITAPYGVRLNEDRFFELLVDPADAKRGVTQFIQALQALSDWDADTRNRYFRSLQQAVSN